MEDKFIRFTKLYIIIFLMFLSIPVIIGLLVGAFYGFSKIIFSGTADKVFQLLMISIPAAVFSTVHIIFLKRTKQHPSGIIRFCSSILFIAGIALSLFFVTKDIIYFFNNPGYNIDHYVCFSIPFLAGNIGGLFLIAIIQAFTTHKEKDWIERE